jgi:hypothetical protein
VVYNRFVSWEFLRDFAELVLLRGLVFVLSFGEKGEEQAGGWKDSAAA